MPASAASVAAELLAFHREPVVHRPRYLHGQQPLPAGHVVFRLALGRFPHGLAREISRADREQVRIAALEFVREVCLWERSTHYQLLCVAPAAGRDEIRENYQLLIALTHPDRQEPDSPAWPTGCAQRANQAYATLSDANARAEYDAGLRSPAEAFESRPREGASFARHRRPRSGTRVASLAKRAAVLAGVIATLFVVQSWWVGGLKPEYSLLERAMPSSARWARSSPDSPRFLGNAPIDTGPLLEPIKEPRRLASLAAWVPIPAEARATPAAPQLAATASAPGAIPIPVAAAAPAEGPPLKAAPTLAVARVEPAAQAVQAAPPPIISIPAPLPAPAASAPTPRQPVVAAEPPVRIAQAGTAPPPVATTPSRDQVEGVVALLVGYYDAGDSEHLVGLVDPEALGWWQGYRMRTAYSEFFGATRSRKLRMDRLTWHNNGAVAEARGEATVVAEYADGRPRMERRVPVELDIALRAGAPRVTRLVLFPGA